MPVALSPVQDEARESAPDVAGVTAPPRDHQRPASVSSRTVLRMERGCLLGEPETTEGAMPTP